MKLDKFLNNTYFASSSDAKKLIKKGIVSVNNKIIKDPSCVIDEKKDSIKVNDLVIHYQEKYYYVLNKPKGYVTSTSDPINPTVMTLFNDLPQFLQKNLFPIGRLDLDTEGLLIITNDGEFAHFVTNPKSNIEKTYYIEFEGKMRDDASEILSKELNINSEIYKPSSIKMLSDSSCNISISEGKYHQIKKMTNYLGVCLTYLKRIKIGALELNNNLEVGKYIEIKENDIKKLIKKD